MVAISSPVKYYSGHSNQLATSQQPAFIVVDRAVVKSQAAVTLKLSPVAVKHEQLYASVARQQLTSSPVTYSELSRNSCYGLQPLMTALADEIPGGKDLIPLL